jgi:membrane fusion protein (multidrug efflux system)
MVAWIIFLRWDVWEGAAGPQWTDDAYLHAGVTPLSAQVPGYIGSVAVADFQAVKQGDLIALIVDKDYRAKVAQAEANLTSAEASLKHIRALRNLQKDNIAAAAAAIQATEAILTRNRLEANRQQTVFASRIAGTQERVQQAVASEKQSAADLEQNKARLQAAKQQLAVYDAQEEQASASISAQKAALDLARINLGHTRIYAPADGMVSQRQVQPGQFAGVGTQIITFVPLPNVWVIANYKETQLTHLEIGQPATITVDTFPDVIIKGHVESYSPAAGAVLALLPPDNATGNFTKVVRRIPVKIAIDDPGSLADKLRPGMSVISTIDTSKPGRSFRAADRGG